MNPNDTYGIIPRAATAARVTPFEFQVRTLADYDVNYMRDQIRSDIFINGKPAGVYAVAVVDEAFTDCGAAGLQEAILRYGPNLERTLVEEFMGLDYRRRVKALERELQALREHVNRPRWWQFHPARRQITAARHRVARAFRRVADRVTPDEAS